MNNISLVGRDGYVRNLDPTEIEDVDVSAVDWECNEPAGKYLWINTGGDVSLKLIGDSAFHVLTVPDAYELRMAVKSIESANTTATGIKALF